MYRKPELPEGGSELESATATAPADGATRKSIGPRPTKSYNVYRPGDDDDLVLVERVSAKTKTDACWKVAEGALRDEATGDDPPKLVAIAADAAEPKAYAVETVTKRSRG